MNRVGTIITTVLITSVVAGILFGTQIARLQQQIRPSDMLGFHPVHKGSPPLLIRMAQAELCRHGIDVKIDGDCGKQTALGICELLHKIEFGYKVKSIYESPTEMVEEMRHDIEQGIEKIDKTVKRIRRFQVEHGKTTGRKNTARP